MAHFKVYPSVLFSILLLVTASSGARAETGRYTMTPTKDGVLKLDTKTGAVSLCRNVGTGWSCENVDEPGKGLHARIDRLERENERLRARLERRSGSGSHDCGKLQLPSEQEVDKTMDFVEKLLNRFKGMIEDLKKDKKQEEEGVPL